MASWAQLSCRDSADRYPSSEVSEGGLTRQTSTNTSVAVLLSRNASFRSATAAADGHSYVSLSHQAADTHLFSRQTSDLSEHDSGAEPGETEYMIYSVTHTYHAFRGLSTRNLKTVRRLVRVLN